MMLLDVTAAEAPKDGFGVMTTRMKQETVSAVEMMTTQTSWLAAPAVMFQE